MQYLSHSYRTNIDKLNAKNSPLSQPNESQSDSTNIYNEPSQINKNYNVENNPPNMLVLKNFFSLLNQTPTKQGIFNEFKNYNQSIQNMSGGIYGLKR